MGFSHRPRPGFPQQPIRVGDAFPETSYPNFSQASRIMIPESRLETMHHKLLAFAIATYGSESWAMTEREEKRVDVFEVWAYRRLPRTSWQEHQTNTWVLEKLRTPRRCSESRKPNGRLPSLAMLFETMAWKSC